MWCLLQAGPGGRRDASPVARRQIVAGGPWTPRSRAQANASPLINIKPEVSTGQSIGRSRWLVA